CTAYLIYPVLQQEFTIREGKKIFVGASSNTTSKESIIGVILPWQQWSTIHTRLGKQEEELSEDGRR
ncbi:hypothetical protein NPIL_3361, partial [Nephila pilipes]